MSTVVYAVLVLSIVFSVEIPLDIVGTQYASINSEDVAILLVTISFVYEKLRNGWRIQLQFPSVTIFLMIFTVWILASVLIASVRTPSPVTVSYLWTLKWLEGIVLFVILQDQVDEVTGRSILKVLAGAGIVLALYAVSISYLKGNRVRVFFGNPNTLSVFFVLVTLLFVGWATEARSWRFVGFLGASVVSFTAILTTGSRSGVLGITIGLVLLVLLLRSRFSESQLATLASGVSAGIVSLPVVLGPHLIERYTEWIRFGKRGVTLTDTVAARSFRIRIRLMKKAFSLFQEAPIFGHGWFASPSRIGYLDVHYTTLLAEIGVVGLVLALVLYLTIVRAWMNIRDRGAFTFGSVGAAWYCALLVQNVGGNFSRTPQIVFLTFVVLTAARAVTTDDRVAEAH